jgi:hypothetical protein
VKLYKDSYNHVFAFELNGSQDELIPSDLIEISESEAEFLRNPPKSLEVVKEEKRTFLNACRDKDESSGFIFNGKIYDSTERSVLRITTAALSAQLAIATNQPFSLDWTTADNSTVTLSAQETASLPLYLALHGKALHEKCKTLKTQVEACNSVEEVESIVW